MSFNAAEPSLDALIRNPNQRTPCVLVLDASGSMDSQSGSGRSRIEELNRGLQALETELKSDPVAKTRVQVAIVCVGGPAGDADVMLDWTDAMDFQAFPLVAGGQTFLGKGMQLALQLIEQQKQAYRSAGVGYTRPWIMVITDGEPSDDHEWDQATKACRAAESSGKCVIYPIGVSGANVAKLQMVSATQALILDQVRFVELFKWLSKSVTAITNSTPGQSVQLPSTDAWVAVKA